MTPCRQPIACQVESLQFNLVRTAVLYGPNASGKSNLISALGFMRSMVEISAVGIREGQKLNISSFRFDSETINQPSEFEVTFVENGIRYQYGFELNATRVTKEWLTRLCRAQSTTVV